MDWAKLASLSVGLVAFLGALYLFLRYKPWRTNGHSGNGKPVASSGALSPEEWEGRMRRLHFEANEELMENLRNLLDARNEKVRQIVREELAVFVRRKP